MRTYQGAVPGACVVALQDGVAIFRRAYGLANVESRVAATTATNYRLASLTKQFTSAAILLLAEEGRLTIDDPVRNWLPTLPEAAGDTVIRHLLTHTSGLIDYEDLIPDGTTAPLRDVDVLRLLEAENRGYFPPGRAYRYSNSGYSLLALIVEHASGKDFASFLALQFADLRHHLGERLIGGGGALVALRVGELIDPAGVEDQHLLLAPIGAVDSQASEIPALRSELLQRRR